MATTHEYVVLTPDEKLNQAFLERHNAIQYAHDLYWSRRVPKDQIAVFRARGGCVDPGAKSIDWWEGYTSNPLRQGYSRAVISENIREAIRSGRPQPQAIAMALTSARRSYRERHPRGSFPRHLQESYTANAKLPGVKRSLQRWKMVLSYGTLPDPRDYSQAYRDELGDKPFHLLLRGRQDALAADGTIFAHAVNQGVDYDEVEIWQGLKQLQRKWERGRKGAEEAGDLASSILFTLGFEWV